jgi:WD40 repeat protein
VEAGELGRLGPYRVVKVLGTGGMGVVFQARDPDLERFVALKAMKPALAASDSSRRRFLREARATAALEHDHIVHIYQVAEDRGIPYLAMPMLKGETLEDRLRRDKPLPAAEVLRIGREVAEGLAAAHQAGLIHRDIKPSNIWLEGERGRVKILDFGLARAEADGSQLTQTGAVAGTPEYMAPEQAQGEKVDARCDLFSLGCVLYRACTGEVPFKGNTTMSLLLALAQQQTRPPHVRNPETPRALSDLVMRLLAKEPSGRPPSARAVVEAIEAIERERATPPPLPARARPPVRSARGWAAAAAVLFLGAIAFAATLVLQTKDGTLTVTTSEPDVKVLVDDEEKITIDSKKAGKVELRPGKHRMSVRRGEEELFTETFTLKSGGVEVIHAEWKPKPPPPPPPSTPPAGPLDKLDAAQIPAEERFAWQPKELVAVLGTHRQRPFGQVRRNGMALSPDGKLLACADEFGLISLFDASTLRRRATLQAKQANCFGAAFSPDSKMLACGKYGAVQVWDVTGDEPRELQGTNLRCSVMAFRPGEGRILAMGEIDGTVRMWNLTETGLRKRGVTLKADGGEVVGLAFSGDGKRLATLGRVDQIVRLWDLRGPAPVEQWSIPLKDKEKAYAALALSRDGKLLAVADPATTLRLWDLTEAGPKERNLRATAVSTGGAAPSVVAFAPDEKTIAAGCNAGAGLALWDVTGEPKRALHLWGGHERFVNLAFSPDGRSLLSLGDGGGVRQWDLSGGELKERMPLEGHCDVIRSLVFDAKEQTLVSGSMDSTLRYWGVSAARPSELAAVPVSTYGRYGLVMPSGGQPLAFAPGPSSRWAQLWDLTGRTAKERARFPWWRAHSFSADGNTLAYCTQVAVRVVDTRNEKLAGLTLDHPEEVRFLALSPNGRLLACEQGEKVRLWDLSGAPRFQVVPAKVGQVMALAFAPDSRTLVVGGDKRGLHVWDVSGETAEELSTISATRNWGALTFSPDGAALVGRNAEGVFLWDAATWRLRQKWSLQGVVSHAAFVGDSRHLAFGNHNGTIYILRLPASAAPAPPLTAKAPEPPPAASPLDQLDAAKIPADERIPDQPGELVAVAGSQAQRHYGGSITSIAWSPDGKRIATGSTLERVAYVWDTETMRRLTSIPHRGYSLHLAYSADGKTLAVGSPHPSSVQLLDVIGAEPKLRHSITRQHCGAGQLAFLPGPAGERLAVLHLDAVRPAESKLVLYDVAGAKAVERAGITLPAARGLSLAFSADGKTLAAAGPEETIRLWDLSPPEPKERPGITGVPAGDKSVALSPDGKTLALVQGTLPLRLWDLSGAEPRPRPVAEPPRDYRHASSLAFSPVGQTLAVGNYLHIDLWDLRGEAKWKAKLSGHTSRVGCMAFSPDGRRLASGGADGTVRQWDLSADPPRERFPLAGHENEVTSLAFAPGDGELYSAARDGTVRSWKVEAGRLLEKARQPLKGMEGSIVKGSFAGQRRVIGYGNSYAPNTLWDLRGAEPKAVEPRLSAFQAAALSADGDRLARVIKNADKVQVETLDLRREKARPAPLASLPTDAYLLCLSPDGRWLAVANFAKGGPVYLLGLADRQKRRLLTIGFPETPSALAFSPDSRTLVAGGISSGLKLWDVSGPQPGDLGTIATGYYPVSLAFSADGHSLACGTQGGEVYLHGTADAWRVRHRWQLPVQSARTLAFAGDGRHLAVGNANGTIYVLRVPPRGEPAPAVVVKPPDPPAVPRDVPLDKLDASKIAAEERIPSQPKELVAVAGSHAQRHTGLVRTVSWSADGRRIASGSSGEIILWDAATMRRLPPVPQANNFVDAAFGGDGTTLAVRSPNPSSVRLIDLAGAEPATRDTWSRPAYGTTALAFSPSRAEPLLAVRQIDGRITLWDLANGKRAERAVLSVPKGQHASLAFSGDGKTFAFAGADEVVRLWDLRANPPAELPPVTYGRPGTVKWVALSPDGKTLALTANTGPPRLWDLGGKAPRPRASAGAPPSDYRFMYSIAFSPDGRTVAVGGHLGIELWDVRGEARWKATLRADAGAVTCLAFSPDGRRLVSGGGDATVRQWDVTADPPRERFPLTAHKNTITYLAFGPDDRELLSGARDGTLRSWKVEDGRLKEQSKVLLPGMEGSSVQRLSTGQPQAITYGTSVLPSTQWDLRGAEPKRMATAPGGALGAYSPDGRWLAWYRKPGGKPQIELVDLRDEKAAPAVLPLPADAAFLSFSPNGRWLACGNTAKGDPVYLFDLAARPRPRLQALGYAGTLRALAFSPDSRTLVAASLHSTLQLWDVSGAQSGDLGSVPGAYYPVALAFSHDGRTLACATHGGEVILHDPADAWRARHRWQLPFQSGQVLAFAHDNRHLAVGNANGTIYVLRVPDASDPATPVVLKPAEPPAAAPVGPLDKLDAAQIPAEERFPFQPKELVAVLGTHRQRHFAQISYMTLSPDGKQVVCGIPPGSGIPGIGLSVFDTATLRRRTALRVDALCVAYSPDGNTLACGNTNIVRFLNPAEPDRGQVARPHPGTVDSLAYAPGGTLLATGSRDGVLRLWDTAGWKELARGDAGPGGVQALSFSADGKTLASLAIPGATVRIWAVEGAGLKERASIALAEPTRAYHRCLALSPDGKTLAVGDPKDAAMPRLWDLSGPQPKERLLAPPGKLLGGAWTVAFSRDGKALALGSARGFALWDVSGEPRLTGAATGAHVCVAFSPDGRTLLTGGYDSIVRSWDVSGAEPKERVPLDAQPRGRIWSLASVPGEPTLVSAGADDRVRYWDLRGAGPKEQAPLALPNTSGVPIALPALGQPLAGADRLWDLTGRKAVERAKVQAEVFSADGSTAAHHRGKAVSVWDMRQPNPKRQDLPADEEVGVRALSPEGRWLACSQKENVRLTDLSNPAPNAQMIQAKVGEVHGLGFSPDSRTLVVNGSDHRLQVWDLSDGRAREVANLPARFYLRVLNFSPDGKYLVGASVQEGVIVWDTTTWRLLHRWVMPNVVSTAVFVGDSHHLALGNMNGTIYILRLPGPR